MSNVKQHYLYITAILDTLQNNNSVLYETIYELGCEICFFKSHIHNNKEILMCVISGAWNNIGKLETRLQKFKLDGATHLLMLPTTGEDVVDDQKATMPYNINIIGASTDNVISLLLEFCSMHTLTVRNVSKDNIDYNPHCYNIIATIDVAIELSLSDIRDAFLMFCDRLNIDGVLEPVRAY